jgi:LPPG:FO 2-phospho-L-lactate transferase
LRVTALAGGTGSAKLLRGIYSLPVDLTVIANVGDNIWMNGLYVCPDLDIAMYTLGGIANPETGWGIAGDSFGTLSQLSRLGGEAWFKLGDRDMATSMRRTAMLRQGTTLTKITEVLRKSYGVSCKLLPATNDELETRIITPVGDMHLQEFWVRERGKPDVADVRYRGASKARITREAKEGISEADRIIICPANPITSVGPMLAVRGFARALAKSDARVVALSPMVGGAPYSGPAGKLMKAVGKRADSIAIASMYRKFVDSIVISSKDVAMEERIQALGMECMTSDTTMKTSKDERRLAKELLEI